MNLHNLLAEQASTSTGRIIPEFFPLPSRGRDPYFGISRSSYYDLEARGLLRLARLRKPGNIRGKVLVPYAAALAAVNALAGNAGRKTPQGVNPLHFATSQKGGH